MCGRTACTLCQSDLQKATQQYSWDGELTCWLGRHCFQTYKPCYNVGPGKVTPVLIKKDLVEQYGDPQQVILFPMRWGFIPSWYKGEIEDFKMHTHNTRSETILEKPTFKAAISAGQRCVVLADGFFEWKKTGKSKCPYFIFFANDNGINMQNRTWKDEDFYTDDDKWNGPRLLTMAGIYDKMGSIYSYSILTMNASKTLLPIHDRMPVILDGKEKVRMWLDSENVSAREALSNLEAVENLEMYQVDSMVNSWKNDVVDCVLPVVKKDVDKKMSCQSKITSWFGKGECTGNQPKKMKLTHDKPS